MKLKNILILAALMSLASVCHAGTPVTIYPWEGTPNVDKIAPPANSTTSWVVPAGFTKTVKFQNLGANSVYMSTSTNVTSSIGWKLFPATAGVQSLLELPIKGPKTLYFYHDAAGTGDVRALYITGKN